MANHLVIAGIVSNERNLIMQRAAIHASAVWMGRPFRRASQETSAHLAHSYRLVGSTTYRVRCCANSALLNVTQLRSRGHRSNSARLINEMPRSRPFMYSRYRNARESPLKSIDTTSASTIAAFIGKGLVRSLLGATSEASPRSRRHTHLLRTGTKQTLKFCRRGDALRCRKFLQ
jgi:hypothetical protein